MALDIGWVDLALAACLLISVLIGLVRGVVFEVLSLAGWVVAYVAAQWFGPTAQAYVPAGEPGSALNHGVAFACVFLAALIAWGLAARLVRALIRATPLSVIDRLLGALFGVLRGMIVLLVIAALIGVTPLQRSIAWQQSQGAVWLSAAVQSLKSWWPGDVSTKYPSA